MQTKSATAKKTSLKNRFSKPSNIAERALFILALGPQCVHVLLASPLVTCNVKAVVFKTTTWRRPNYVHFGEWEPPYFVFIFESLRCPGTCTNILDLTARIVKECFIARVLSCSWTGPTFPSIFFDPLTTSSTIFNRGQGVQLGSAEKQLQQVVPTGLEPTSSGFQVRRPNHSATLPPIHHYLSIL